MALTASAGKLGIRVFPDTSRLREDLAVALSRVERQLKADLEVSATLSRASIQHVRQQLAEIGDSADVKATAKVEPEVVDTASSRASLALLTRRRLVELVPHIDQKALLAAGSSLAALGGGRVLGDVTRNVGSALGQLDRFAAKAMLLAPALVSLGSVGLTGLSGAVQTVVALGAALSATLPAAAALPGLLAAAAAGGIAFSAAFAVAKVNLAGYASAFTSIRDATGTAAWDVGGQRLVAAIDAVLPVLSAGMVDIGRGVGEIMGSIAAAATSAEGLARIGEILSSTADAMPSLATAGGDFASALLSLSSVGASLLPGIAAAAADTADTFAQWAQRSADSGAMLDWINGGISALRNLGAMASDVGGILGGMARAMGATGGQSQIDALAGGLDRLNQAVNGPAFQGALTTLFTGAGDGVRALYPALDALGNSIVTLAPLLAEIMTTSGGALNTLLTSVAGVLADPAFMDGVSSMFTGLSDAVTALAPSLGVLGPLLGTVAETVGVLAATIGPLLGTLLEQLAPVLQELLVGLQPIIPLVGEQLASALLAAAPVIATVVEALVSWMAANPELAATIIAVGAVVAPLLAGLVSLVSVIAPIVSAFSAMAPVVAALVSPVGAVIVAVGALVAGFAYAYSHFEGFRNGVDDVRAAIGNFIAEVIQRATELPGALAAIPEQVGSFFTGLRTDFFNIGQNLMQGFIDGIGGMVNSVKDTVGGVFGGIVGQTRGLLGIHSPSRVFAQLGRYTGQGFTAGIASQEAHVQMAMASLVTPPAVGDIAPPGGPGAAGGAVAGGGTINIYNPVQEKRAELNRKDANLISEDLA